MSDSIRDRYEEAGQGQVFRFFDQLSAEEQQTLISQAEGIDLSEVDELVRLHVKGEASEDKGFEGLAPAEFLPLPRNGGDAAAWDAAFSVGEDALRAGRVAAFTVAGGQGTRLGFDGPKGTFPVTPMTESTLFQVFAEKILAAGRRYGKPVPWYIMTSAINHEPTVAFFEEHDFFGLDSGDVKFFSQGLMPAVDPDGKILLADKSNIALSPDGHGGSLRALVRNGCIDDMKARGVDIISYFQVDNPLVNFMDPAFIGFHLQENSELSSKALPKANAAEKVGVFCSLNGRACVIEYSDLPDELSQKVDERGELVYRGGSIAIHIFSRDFVEKVGSGQDASVKLPFHRANKKVPIVDEAGNPVKPTEPNGVKFEMFVFDALPFAENAVIIETAREDEFSPVKNAEGTDSPATSRRDQLRQWARWVKAAGLALEVNAEGDPAVTFEISPLFADSAAALAARKDEVPAITEGLVLK